MSRSSAIWPILGRLSVRRELVVFRIFCCLCLTSKWPSSCQITWRTMELGSWSSVFLLESTKMTADYFMLLGKKLRRANHIKKRLKQFCLQSVSHKKLTKPRARNNGRRTENVRPEWGLDRPETSLVGHVDVSRRTLIFEQPAKSSPVKLRFLSLCKNAIRKLHKGLATYFSNILRKFYNSIVKRS